MPYYLPTDYLDNTPDHTLAEQLDAYFVEHDLYREFIEPSVLEQIREEDLQLVCYSVLST